MECSAPQISALLYKLVIKHSQLQPTFLEKHGVYTNSTNIVEQQERCSMNSCFHCICGVNIKFPTMSPITHYVLLSYAGFLAQVAMTTGLKPMGTRFTNPYSRFSMSQHPVDARMRMKT